ncbi:hypothetical protein TSOC_000733 [Tetrabaena socialis]|uniref:Uncharacterized protein n=1 Tax=Tetrabaena socialis TaxID=47790 RepID=A0A2J8AIL4_9CHLO|nr:hypothetical protein TSOC_000733 [Tetrabaena socialis]|eukprot:PNH12359.1 hypothetical protein TSOC_000733 [Tetrabaena socialis]
MSIQRISSAASSSTHSARGNQVLPGRQMSSADLKADVELANGKAVPSSPSPSSSGSLARRGVASAVPPTDDGPAEVAGKEEEEEERYATVTYFDILKHFSLMGYIGFGGPAAHIGLGWGLRVKRAGGGEAGTDAVGRGWGRPWRHACCRSWPLTLDLMLFSYLPSTPTTTQRQGNDGGVESLGFGMIGGGILIGAWMVVLIVVLVLARTVYKDGDGPLNWFEVFYRTGSIIYGGGQFKYTFILGAVLAWFGLFAPGVMLMFGVLPYWKRFRTWQIYRRGLSGMNAVGVGLILASVFSMTVDVYRLSPFPKASLCIALFAFTAVDSLAIFEPFVVLGGAALGVLGWGADMN